MERNCTFHTGRGQCCFHLQSGLKRPLNHPHEGAFRFVREKCHFPGFLLQSPLMCVQTFAVLCLSGNQSWATNDHLFRALHLQLLGGTLKIPRDLESLHPDLPPFRLASLTLFCKWQQIWTFSPLFQAMTDCLYISISVTWDQKSSIFP